MKASVVAAQSKRSGPFQTAASLRMMCEAVRYFREHAAQQPDQLLAIECYSVVDGGQMQS